MAGWISSKLKAAETLLHQIDQQAADSLGKSPSASDLAALQPSADSLLDVPPRRRPPAGPPPSLGLRLAVKHPSPSQPPPSPAPRRSASAAAVLAVQDQVGGGPVGVVAEAKAEGDREDGKGGASESVSGSDEDSDGSGSDDSEDSEEERRREEERRQRRAERLAVMAARAIAEREEAVARLEGEKAGLEKLLAEREKEQAQEASELQTSMIETMEAMEVEKQRHHSTRMEALARLARLEVTNAELSKSLAREQWNLEVQVDQVAQLREEVELKILAQDKYKRKIAKIQKTSAPPVEIESLRRFKLDQEIIDAEYKLTCDRIVSLKDNARKIEENIELTRRDMMHPTEVEIELKKRLAQLTDRLIQKQMQVESLSSEKAALSMRIEAVSRLLDNNASSLASWSSSSRIDIEAGAWQESNSPRLRDRIRAGQQQLGSAIRQLDSIFSAGHIFLRRNPKAQVWALVYLVSFHLWVLYILTSHPTVSEIHPGAVFSLESINKTSI
ncbi:golgin candidate 2-like [Phragmites australis]|uniref:golgin candidate 2-like n=1 Tax=Phragmites australis TaxID=29695 RepID=UPI002D795E1F|nr:golgin candidate 2-like [Phragmites australis]